MLALCFGKNSFIELRAAARNSVTGARLVSCHQGCNPTRGSSKLHMTEDKPVRIFDLEQ